MYLPDVGCSRCLAYQAAISIQILCLLQPMERFTCALSYVMVKPWHGHQFHVIMYLFMSN